MDAICAPWLTVVVSRLARSCISALEPVWPRAAYCERIVAAAESYEPHRIAGRIYRLARDFSAFYDKAPVLKAETPELRDARLYLVEMTGKVLATGLALLGIEVTDRM